jgi:LPS O-antigen subunit length determinant protein (WzzB/FepE family)
MTQPVPAEIPDPPEVEDLERAAAWRLRKLDADPADRQSAAAAQRLQRLADELRQMQASPLYREFSAICNWLAESEDITDFAQLAHEYRLRIGVDVFPETGEDYLRALLEIARQTFGSP